jgi:hypothetical protein
MEWRVPGVERGGGGSGAWEGRKSYRHGLLPPVAGFTPRFRLRSLEKDSIQPNGLLRNSKDLWVARTRGLFGVLSKTTPCFAATFHSAES